MPWIFVARKKGAAGVCCVPAVPGLLCPSCARFVVSLQCQLSQQCQVCCVPAVPAVQGFAVSWHSQEHPAALSSCLGGSSWSGAGAVPWAGLLGSAVTAGDTRGVFDIADPPLVTPSSQRDTAWKGPRDITQPGQGHLEHRGVWDVPRGDTTHSVRVLGSALSMGRSRGRSPGLGPDSHPGSHAGFFPYWVWVPVPVLCWVPVPVLGPSPGFRLGSQS